MTRKELQTRLSLMRKAFIVRELLWEAGLKPRRVFFVVTPLDDKAYQRFAAHMARCIELTYKQERRLPIIQPAEPVR